MSKKSRALMNQSSVVSYQEFISYDMKYIIQCHGRSKPLRRDLTRRP